MNRLLALLAPLFVAVAMLTAVPTHAAVPGLDFTATGCDGYSDSVARLYTAGLDRPPEKDGFEYWLVQYTRGKWNLRSMADFFAQSPEFQATYGDLTQDGFIRQLYRNVHRREGERGGVTFWNGEMSKGMTRGTVLLRFAESPENIERSGTTPPTLGDFNAGLTGPWGCLSWPPPNPRNSVNCVDFRTQAEAQAWFDYYYPAYGDVADLDRDNDLLPCEHLP